MALHALVLALVLSGRFIHLPQPPQAQYIQAVLVAPRHVARPHPVPPAPSPVEAPPAPVMPPEPKPRPLPPVAQEHHTPLPTVENRKAIAHARPRQEPVPPRPVPQPREAPPPKPASKPAPKPAPKKPVINQQDVNDEMSDIDQLADQAKAAQHAQEMQQLQQEAAANLKAMSAKANRQIVGEFSRRINAQVSRNWIRPLSARNGMTTVLDISLQPTGDVETGVIEHSSGDAAFDNAAVAAVWKASPLPVPDDADVFNSNFRPLHLKFRTEDL
jgi:colicin import membrane protein